MERVLLCSLDKFGFVWSILEKDGFYYVSAPTYFEPVPKTHFAGIVLNAVSSVIEAEEKAETFAIMLTYNQEKLSLEEAIIKVRGV